MEKEHIIIQMEILNLKVIGFKAEGNGKYIWKDGEYYIGQFKNGLSHGKGTKYISNRNIKYESGYIRRK